MGEKTDRRSRSRDASDVASVTQTRSGETGQVYQFGPYRLNPGERTLLRGNEGVTLPTKAFDTLVLMVRNSGRLMEKEELIRTLWPDSFVEDGSLSNNIFVLRKALGEDPRYIETVPKRGYRFVGAVRCFPDGERERRDEAESRARLTLVTLDAKVLPRSRSRALWGIGALLLFALPVAAGWYYRNAWRSDLAIRSVAVLPFENASGDPTRIT